VATGFLICSADPNYFIFFLHQFSPSPKKQLIELVDPHAAHAAPADDENGLRGYN
jgi:hypothetical protein